MGILGDFLDATHNLVTAPIKAVDNLVSPRAPTKAVAAAAAKAVKPAATAILRPAAAPKVEQKRILLSNMAQRVAQEPIRYVTASFPQPSGPDGAQLLAFLREALEPRFTAIANTVKDITTSLSGLSDHVKVVEAELLARIVFVETVVIASLRQENEATKMFVMATAGELMATFVEGDPDLGMGDRAAHAGAVRNAKSPADLIKAWMTYRAASASLWNRIKASAPQWASSLILTGVYDFNILGSSRNVRLVAAIDSVIALWLGNDRPSWLAAGAIPLVTVLADLFQIPTTCTATLQFDGGWKPSPLPNSVEAQLRLNGLPDVFVMGSRSYEIIEARFETERNSVRVDLDVSSGIDAASLVAGKALKATLPLSRFTAPDATPGKITLRVRGSNPSNGIARETVVTTTSTAAV